MRFEPPPWVGCKIAIWCLIGKRWVLCLNLFYSTFLYSAQVFFLYSRLPFEVPKMKPFRWPWWNFTLIPPSWHLLSWKLLGDITFLLVVGQISNQIIKSTWGFTSIFAKSLSYNLKPIQNFPNIGNNSKISTEVLRCIISIIEIAEAS